MFATRVALVADHVIAAVVYPSKASLNVPPVGVPPIVSVWTSLVPPDGTPAFCRGTPREPGITCPPEMTGKGKPSVLRRATG
jgi:hypothetical protein